MILYHHLREQGFSRAGAISLIVVNLTLLVIGAYFAILDGTGTIEALEQLRSRLN
ncbi:hypothetical protein [Methylobacterium nodulans]|uniref:Uncharacterized protein n=1 Tax=Methylobacterium nodulans (strain LMG 21967 / CNCM I-2342 / ORS 2060) TaxID=460265 RepID=B8IWK4_METNO|nr:hypothetical protein [Methylobacterium nodulans]ACL62794.1 hypothetical protein Mnod_8738 [Methylobacterium nodulans ORS 2060]